MLPGSGTAVGVRKPRISPAGNSLEWTFKYDVPAAALARSAASAPAVVPPFAVMKAGLYDEAEVKSSKRE